MARHFFGFMVIFFVVVAVLFGWVFEIFTTSCITVRAAAWHTSKMSSLW